jgi:hypothetical protein
VGVVLPVRLDDLVADLVEGVQRGERVLEDHRHLGPAQGTDLILAHGHELLAVQPDLTGDPGAASLVDAEDRQAGHGLARAGLTDDAKRVALGDLEGQAIDGLHQAILGREVNLEIPNFEERLRRLDESRLVDHINGCAHH